jgi:hypothetical protein
VGIDTSIHAAAESDKTLSRTKRHRKVRPSPPTFVLNRPRMSVHSIALTRTLEKFQLCWRGTTLAVLLKDTTNGRIVSYACARSALSRARRTYGSSL